MSERDRATAKEDEHPAVAEATARQPEREGGGSQEPGPGTLRGALSAQIGGDLLGRKLQRRALLRQQGMAEAGPGPANPPGPAAAPAEQEAPAGGAGRKTSLDGLGGHGIQELGGGPGRGDGIQAGSQHLAPVDGAGGMVVSLGIGHAF